VRLELFDVAGEPVPLGSGTATADTALVVDVTAISDDPYLFALPSLGVDVAAIAATRWVACGTVYGTCLPCAAQSPGCASDTVDPAPSGADDVCAPSGSYSRE
jgi:hypothetical protein